VRLITGPNNPYNWIFLPKKRHLFKKYISKYLIRAYMELCYNVGILFKAIPANISIYYTDYLKENTS
ncbi:hypothetical protein V2W45_1242710, partial [Cenococcum geophilum]